MCLTYFENIAEKLRKLSHWQGENSCRKTFCPEGKKANETALSFCRSKWL